MACGKFLQNLAKPLTKKLRAWDVESSKRVDQFVANSSFIARRVADYYKRDSTVIHPPVRTDFFHPVEKVKKENGIPVMIYRFLMCFLLICNENGQVKKVKMLMDFFHKIKL